MDWHVETELLAYLDGELSERERAQVEAHLLECAVCAAELERLRTLRQELDATFDAALSPVRLPAAADRRIRDRLRARTEPRPWWGLWRRRGLLAQALLAVLVLVFTLNVLPTLGPPLAAPPETLVLGQDRLSPGSEAALRVIVRSADGAEPVEGAEVVVRIGRTPGLASAVYTGRTGAGGSAEVAFAVPEGLEGQASLVVETRSAAGEDRIVHPITIARDYRLFLSSDKPAYRPGQVIHLRALALDEVNLKPATGQEVAFAILAPSGSPLSSAQTSTGDFGIAAHDFSLPPDAAPGRYTLQAALGDTVSERSVTVGDYELPAFRLAVETDRTFYTPGQRVEGSIRAEYFFGKPVADGQVTLRGYVGEPERVRAVQIVGQTDAQGLFSFTFDLPASLGLQGAEERATFELEIEVVDPAGRREGLRRVLPVAARPILIDAIPESGLLKPGVENVIFVLTSYPDGRPAETTLTAEIGGQAYTLATGPYGLAQLRHVPTAPVTQLDVRAVDARGAGGHAAFTFESDRAPRTLLLRAERAAYRVGDTLRLEALLSAGDEGDTAPPQTVYLDVVRTRQTIATLSAPISGEAGRALFALDLDGTMVGTLELHAYAVLPDGGRVEDTRLVVVDAPRRVAVAVAADREQYQPGETAHLQLQTTISPTGGPVQSALGIGVVDESVYALEEMPPGFVRAYFLLERELLKRRARVDALDVPTLLDAKAEIRAAQDVAARAAWAGASGTDFTLAARSTAGRGPEAAARTALSNRLGLAVALLPLLLGGAVVQGLRRTGVLGRALRRVAMGLLLFLLTSPLVALVVGGAMWLLWAVLGVGALASLLLVLLFLLALLTVHGWRRRDARLHLATGLLAAYLALAGLLVLLAARGGDPAALLLALIAITFLLAVAALATLGQGLVLEGWPRTGWATTLLGLLLIPLALYLPFVPGLSSDLTHTLGNPALYAGPLSWLTGCGAAAPMPTEEPAEEPGEEMIEPTAAPTPSAAPSPGEPFPLRQVFSETLYWNAQVLTDESGNLTLDLPLADTITTWRLTALASTREGELGVATYDVIVFQDLFVELDLPPTIARGEVITAAVRVYNYLPQSQTVQIEPLSAEWYDLVSPPQALTLPANGVATTTFSLRSREAGRFSLQVTAVGDRASDAVARELVVEP